MAHGRWRPRSPVCLWCGGPVPPRARAFCSYGCAGKYARDDRTKLLAAVNKALRRGQLAWDGETLSVVK